MLLAKISFYYFLLSFTKALTKLSKAMLNNKGDRLFYL